MSVKLSILIPSIPERMNDLQKILDELSKQSSDKPVEILVMLDNRKRTIGAKRNSLLEQAQGDFVVFVDDDDRVHPNYIDILLAAIDQYPQYDCILYDVLVTINGKYTKICKYGKEYTHGEDLSFYYRKPNCRMCISRRIALKHKFKDMSFGEDDEWGARVSQDIYKQCKIPAILYYYDYVDKSPEWYTRGLDG